MVLTCLTYRSGAHNLLDCACLAGIIALKHFRRPDVEVTGDEVTVVFCFMYYDKSKNRILSYHQHLPSERAPVPLAIHHTPFCFTFAFFPDASTPSIIDPSQLEQRFSAGLMSIALNAQKELCVLQKLGGVPLSTDEIWSWSISLLRSKRRLVETSCRKTGWDEKLKCNNFSPLRGIIDITWRQSHVAFFLIFVIQIFEKANLFTWSGNTKFGWKVRPVLLITVLSAFGRDR